jgi:glycosyltransferase involved in cell wall biosynthesis
MYRIGFIIEQALGHVTHSQNLMANVPRDPEVNAYWGLVPWETHGLAARLPLYRSNWTLRAGLRARRLAGSLGRQAGAPLDALFFHTQVPAVLSLGWLKRVPSVVSLDATPRQYDRLGEYYGHTTGPAALERYKWRLNRDCFRAARHLVTWAGWTKQGLVDDYEVPAEKITVIPPGVNVDQWRRPAPRRLHTGPVKILFVGGNLERKGGLVLLDAFRRLMAEAGRLPILELHLVTRDTLPEERGVFVHTGISPNSDRLKQLYHESDIFCLPTFGDCLPMVLSEAAAAGLPAVATGMAGIPEIVREGETGFLVPRGDPDALAAVLRRLVCDDELRLRLGYQALRLVSADFDASKNTARLLALLKQVARSGAAGARLGEQV